LKSHLLLLTAVALTLLSPMGAQASCSASTIAGTYGFAMQGLFQKPGDTVAKALAYALIGTFTFNPDGTVNRSFTGSFEGNYLSASDSGTYAVNPDCTGAIAMPNTPFGLETYSLTIVANGDGIMFINTTTALLPKFGFVQSSRMERQ
jgi:hypothetical protein